MLKWGRVSTNGNVLAAKHEGERVGEQKSKVNGSASAQHGCPGARRFVSELELRPFTGYFGADS